VGWHYSGLVFYIRHSVRYRVLGVRGESPQIL